MKQVGSGQAKERLVVDTGSVPATGGSVIICYGLYAVANGSIGMRWTS